MLALDAVEELAVEAFNQCFSANDEAIEDNVWFTPMRFKQWGFAERYLATADRWEAV